MPHPNVANWALADYERAAAAYCASLPQEHFMEGIGQATQRKISWCSLDFVALARGRMQVFNELLVQYPRNGGLGQVVPDNMVIRSAKKIKSGNSFNVAFEAAKPFWVLEYVSKSNRRKDYEDNFLKYEEELKVPYYLLFDPDRQDLRVYKHNGGGYERVEPNEAGRLAVPELGVEVALLGGWVRFWYQGELVPLPDDLLREVEALREQLDAARTEAVQQRRRAERQQRRAEQEKERAEEEHKHAEDERKRAEDERKRADHERKRAEDERKRAEAAEEEVKRLRALLEKGGRRGNGR
jgi:Uma2 family endonuclease